MSHFWTIFRRELGAYFNAAIATIFLVVFALFANGLFMLSFFQVGRADMRPLFVSLPFILNIFIPAISMRLWAEDKKGSTFELLLTFPMRPGQLVLGKYLASVVFYLLALSTTLTIPVMLSWAGHSDPGVILGGYLGAILMGALFLAIGIFVSGLCKDQIVAFILTAVFTFTAFFLGTDMFAVVIDGWIPGFGSFLKGNVGIASHLVSFSKGVIDMKDLLYFLLTIAVFLLLNGFSLEGRYRPKAKLIFSGAVAVSIVSLVLLNWLTRDLPIGRFDLTEGQLNTVSPVSKRILANLKVPVQLKLYISSAENMPTMLKTLEREITDKLEELKVMSEGKLKYSVIHPEISDQEDALKTNLRNEGVVPFQVESVQKDEVGVKLIYSTLVIEYKEKPQEILPRMIPQSLLDLEYQLMSRIHKMTLEEKPKIAVYAPVEGEALSQELESILKTPDQKVEKNYEDHFKTAVVLMRNNGYDVSRIALTKNSPVPEGAKTLMLLAPGALNDRQRYEINRFLYQGGTMILAAQGYDYTYTREPTGLEALPKRRPFGINPLIEKWGLKINEDILLDENSQVISLMSDQRIGPFAVQMPVKLPNQIVILESMINRSTSITKRIPSLMYLYGSALDLADNTIKSLGLQSTVLFTSSPRSWTIPFSGANLTEQNTRPPANEFAGKYPLAIFLEGQFSDTFGTGAPAWSEEDSAGSEKMSGPKPGRLLVVGCSHAFNDDVLQNPGNLAFFANAIDGLVLGEDLVQIRSNTVIVRDLRQLSNAEKVWYKFFTILLIPALLLFAAMTRHFIRRKEKEFYLAAIRSAGTS